MLLTITTTAGNSHLVSLLFEFFPTGFLIGVIYSKIQDIHSLKYYMCSECKYNEYQRFVQAFTNLFITIFPLNSLGITADIHFKLLSATLISVLLFITGCENMETRDVLNEEITESAEMEEYILAGLDLHHSLNQFKQELKGIDMLSLTPTLDSRGNMVINIPTTICIEQKTKDFNTKKRVLLQKYPELTNMKSVKRLDQIKETTNNSLKITKAIMGFEFVDIPRLRSVEFEVTEYQSEQDAFNFLDQHIASPDYVEVVLMVFEDGKVMTYITSDNDANNSFYPTLVQKVSGGWYSTF